MSGRLSSGEEAGSNPRRSRTRRKEASPTAVIYTWSNAGPTPPIPAPVFKQTWDSLRSNLGHEPNAEEIVSDARDPSSPIHSCFEWSNTRAAHLYRLDQANGLVRHLRVSFTQQTRRVMDLRALVHVSEGGQRRVIETLTALSQPLTRQQVLADSLRELVSALSKHEKLLSVIGLDKQAIALRQAIQEALDDS